MTLARTFSFVLLIAAASSTLATDHNNIDSGRPLRFDDAYSIAYGERAVEFGLGSSWLRDRSSVYDAKFEFKYGFAKNRDIGIAWHPSFSTGTDRIETGEVEFSYFEQIQREIENAPALAYKVDVGVATERDDSGVEVRLRGIVTKVAKQYDRVHLNMDMTYSSNPDPGERDIRFGVILGYSNPLGAPTKFDKTLVAQFEVEQGKLTGKGWTGNVGLGLRQQVSEQGVLDFGVETDLVAPTGAQKSNLRFTLGYSVGF